MSGLGRYRKIYTRLWSHPSFTALKPAEKVVALYLLTGPPTNRIGLYLLSPARAAEDLQTSIAAFQKSLRAVCEAFDWHFDDDARVFWCPSWWRWNPPTNSQHMRGNLKDLNDLPPSEWVDSFARQIDTIPEDLREAFRQGLQQHSPRGSRDENQKQDLRQKVGTEGAAREKPELRAVRALPTKSKDGGYRGGESRSNQLYRIACDALNCTNPKGSLDELVDAFLWLARSNSIHDCSREDAIAALEAALADRRAVQP